MTNPTTRTLPLSVDTLKWGAIDEISLYLDRCQVDSPPELVDAVWDEVAKSRNVAQSSVVDFGAGDGRFASQNHFKSYVGYEIDGGKTSGATLGAGAKLITGCAFKAAEGNFDICIGNPPYVRNQDLPSGWQKHAAKVIKRQIGIEISGLANAWQYFMFLALARTKPDGLVALVIPYEWVSRPSASRLRSYVNENNWNVSVHRLQDRTFGRVLTTASITTIDKSASEGRWRYFNGVGAAPVELPSPAPSGRGVIEYRRRLDYGALRAKRGLSPGTQKVLTLTEGERVRNALERKRDVVPCVTTLRDVPASTTVLNEKTFKEKFRDTGRKCWLIRTDREPSEALARYLEGVPETSYQTRTCLSRDIWWKFDMPAAPDALLASSFTHQSPKCVDNDVKAMAVGGICGIYGIDAEVLERFRSGLASSDLKDRIVAHSNGLRKLEVGQINTLLAEAAGAESTFDD